MAMIQSPPRLTRRSPYSWLPLLSLFGLGTLAAIAPAILFQTDGQPAAIAPLGSDLSSLVRVEPLRLPVALANGTNVIPPQKANGHSQLTVDNGNPTDALLKLVDQPSGQTVRLVYVQAKHQATLENLGTGTYEIRFALGQDWDGPNQSFRRQQSFLRMEDPVTFKRELAGDTEYWTTYRVTLHRVPGGTVETEPLSPEEF